MAAVQHVRRSGLQPRRDRRRADRHADLPGADLLDHLDGVQAAQPGDDGAADGVLHSRRSRPSSSCSPSASQLRDAVDPEDYDAAPWWEKRGLRRRREGRARRQGRGAVCRPIPNRFMNSLIVAITSTVLAVGMGTITAYGFSRFRVKGEADLLFFILSTRMLPPVVVAIPMFLMYRAVGLERHAHRPDHPLHRLQPVVLGVADEGLHRRDPEGVRGGGAGRRLHAHAGLLQDRAAARRRPASPRPPCSASSPPGTNTPSR